MPLYVWNGSEYVRIDDGSGNINTKNAIYDVDLDGLVDADKIASLTRSKISDFFSSPFWSNIPDRPPIGVVPDDGDLQTVINNLYNDYGGGIVIIKPGTYDIDSPITIPDNIVIIGYGATVRATAAIDYIFTNSDTTNGNKNIGIIGVKLDCNSGNADSGISFTKVTNVTIIDVEILGSEYSAIDIDNATRIVIRGVYIHDQYGTLIRAAIDLALSENCIIENCRIENYASGIRVGTTGGSECKYCTIMNCVIINMTQTYGIRVDGWDNSVIQCFVDTCGEEGIMLYGERNKAINNTVKNCDQGGGGWAGIEIRQNRNIVANNVCFDDQETPTQDYGIREEDGDYNIIIGNICYGNATSSISTVGANTVVANNIT